MSPTVKVCSWCNEEKPVEAFYRRPDTRDRLYGHCKVCHLAYTARHAARNLEAGRAKSRRWAARNPEKKRKMWASWYERNSARQTVKQRERRRRNPERHRIEVAERRRRLKPASADTLSFRRVLSKDPCSYCGRPGQTIDHIQAVTQGGANEWENLTAACCSCNSRKQTKSLLAHLAGAR